MELEIDLSFAKGASWSLDFPVTNNKQHGYACNKGAFKYYINALEGGGGSDRKC